MSGNKRGKLWVDPPRADMSAQMAMSCFQMVNMDNKNKAIDILLIVEGIAIIALVIIIKLYGG